LLSTWIQRNKSDKIEEIKYKLDIIKQILNILENTMNKTITCKLCSNPLADIRENGIHTKGRVKVIISKTNNLKCNKCNSWNELKENNLELSTNNLNNFGTSRVSYE